MSVDVSSSVSFAPQSFSPGHIALSYIISFIGSMSTVELLQRRTSMRGMYNWYLLVGSALTMGGVAIWAMHYIGNRAIVLYPNSPGSNGLQLSYSPGFTALSFFVPIIFLLLAYLLMGTASETVGWLRLGAGGTFAGLSVCGMHYLGQAGISNYHSYYLPGHVVGSVVIAVVATTIALTLFFILRKNFTNSWYKRAFCAVVLSGAVSGMHWTAALGTRYKLQSSSGLTRDTRHMTVIITIVMSVVSCFLVLFFAITINRSRTYERNRAQKIILVSATFDPEGRLMVLPDGTMPTREITDSFREKSFEDGFDKSHPVFEWLYRTTRHWKTLNGLFEGIKLHLRQYNSPDRPHDYSEDYGFVFREEFCVAAQELADGTHRNLENMGILYDEIVITGGANPTKKKNDEPDVETGHGGNGRGKSLFLVKGVDKSESLRLTAHGFRFTHPDNVTENIARSMLVHKESIRGHLKSMESCASGQHELSPGVYLGCFAARANVKGGFDVLVRTEIRSQIPTARLPLTNLGQSHLRFLQEQDQKSVTQIMHTSQTIRNSRSDVSPFVIMFHDALRTLVDELRDPFFSEAVLICQPISVPCQNPIDKEIGVASIIIFKTMVPIHSRTITENPQFEFTPLHFFSLQQRCYPFSPDHDTHARRTHREFSGKASQVPQPSRSKLSNTLTPWQSKGSGPNVTTTTLSSSRNSTSSEKNLVLEFPPNAALNPFAGGGIMVSQSVSIEHAEARSGIEMHSMGPSAAVVKDDDMEDPTWVEILFRGVISSAR